MKRTTEGAVQTVKTQLPGRGRRGFTLGELMLVVVIISILAGLAIPNYRLVVIKARAASALGDVNVVRTAAANYHARSNR